MTNMDILKAVVGIILGIGILYFASGQWMNGIYALLADAVLVRLGSGGSSGGK